MFTGSDAVVRELVAWHGSKPDVVVDALLDEYPHADGRGTTVAVLDTGCDLPAAGLLTTTLNFMLFFAAMGIDLFGGGITSDTESGAIISREDAETLRASAFGENGYYPASFNDLPSALVTLFILLVVNDWNVVVSGYVAVWGISGQGLESEAQPQCAP